MFVGAVAALVGCIFTTTVIASGSIWQVSDTHFSHEYREGTHAMCVEQECCHYGSVAKEGYEDVLAGPWGEFRCHLPERSIVSALQFMDSAQFSGTDIVLWSMDSPGSQIFKQTRELTLEIITTEINLFKKYITTKRVYPVLGNHDYHPLTQWEVPPDCNWLISNVTSQWADWLPEDAMATASIGGYYTVELEKGLRLVALNTAFYDWWDKKANRSDPNWDPANQFSWFESTMSDARKNGEKVIVFSHHFLGVVLESSSPDTIPSFITRFSSLMLSYVDILVSHFAGHLHRDDFRLFNWPEPEVVTFVAPSLTPLYNVYPSVRLFHYDPETFELLDYDQYNYNLTLANIDNSPSWHLLYSALAEYDLPDLSASSWATLVTRMQNDCDLFQKHWGLYYTNSTAAPACDCDKCRTKALCSKFSTTYEDWQDCQG